MNALDELIRYCIEHAPVLQSHAKMLEKLIKAVREQWPQCRSCQYYSSGGKYPRHGNCKHPWMNTEFASFNIKEHSRVPGFTQMVYAEKETLLYVGEGFGCIHHESAAEQSNGKDHNERGQKLAA